MTTHPRKAPGVSLALLASFAIACAGGGGPDAGVDVPLEVPADVAADALHDLAADVPGDLPADVAADVPADLPADAGGDLPAELPPDAPADLPAEAGGDLPTDAPPPVGCNGSESLCGRRYDQVAFATTHNAMSNEDDGWVAPNQPHGLERQWQDGIRGMMLDIHYGDPAVEGMDPAQVYLCHTNCLLGNRLLRDALQALKSFLDGHPRDVATLIFESYVAAADVAAAFEAAGLLPYLHAQAAGEPWPTLDEMAAAGRRLVVLTDREGGDPAWHHDVWAHAFETDWDNKVPADLTCDPNRGSTANPLFILNHFLTAPFATRDLAAQVNVNPFFLDRATRCRDERSSLPNFVTVDFYDVGDVLAVVDALNGVGQGR